MKSFLKPIYDDLLVIAALVGLGLVLYFAFRYTLPQQPATGSGNCGEGWIAKVNASPFSYSGDVPICKVIIKSGSQNQGDACFSFKYPPPSQSNSCYQVSGLGSTSIRASKIGDGPDCKDISHIEVYACPNPTNTPTTTQRATPTDTQEIPTSTSTQEIPTNTPETPTDTPEIPTDTPEIPTDTPATPFKFWTPTPVTITPTLPVTITPTLPVTPTPPTLTLTPPIPTGTPGKGKKPTELPRTGFAEDLPFYVISGIIGVLVIVVARMLRKVT